MPLTIQTRKVMLETVQVALKKIPQYKPQSLAFVIEARFILWRIQRVLNSDTHNHDMQLKQLFQERWWMIKNSNMQYLNDFTSPANEACIAIAKILASKENESYLAILIPDLAKTPPQQYLTSSYTEEHIDLNFLILSDDFTHIMHVRDVLEGAQDDGVLKCNYLVGERVVKLSMSEEQRLLSRHPSVKAAFDAIQVRKKFKLEGDTVGSAVRRLAQGLRDGGARKGGIEHSAGADANVAIFEFNQYRETLAVETLTILDGAAMTDRFLSFVPEKLEFGQLWAILSQPTYEAKGAQTSRYCVEMVAQKIEELLEANPGLYELCSYQGTGLKQLDDLNVAVVHTMREMDARLSVLEHHDCYPDALPETLCLALSPFLGDFRLNPDETAYFFNQYTELCAKNALPRPLAVLVGSICRTHSKIVIEKALSYVSRENQATILRDFNLLCEPVSQVSFFNERKRAANESEESAAKRACFGIRRDGSRFE